MEIIKTAKFSRKYLKLIKTWNKNQVSTIDKNLLESFDLILNDLTAFLDHDHPLEDAMIGLLAFHLAQNCCVVYRIKGNKFILCDIGTHPEVYIRRKKQ